MADEGGITTVVVAAAVTGALMLGVAVPVFFCDRKLRKRKEDEEGVVRREKSRVLEMSVSSSGEGQGGQRVPGHQPGRPKGEEEGPSREESDEGNGGGVSLGSLFLRWNVDLERAKLLSRNAQVYLSFQKHLIVALADMTALCLLILLPVNITSPIDASVLHNRASPDSKFVNGTTEAFDRTTVMYAQGSQSRLGAHVTCLILLSAFITLLLVRFQRSFLQGEAAFENKNNTRLESYTMMLERLPRLPVSEVSKQLGHEVQQVFGDMALHLEVIPRMDKYVKALQELEEAKNSFAHCEAIQLRRQAAGKEPADKKTLVCCCKRVPGAAHYLRVIQEKQATVEKHKRRLLDAASTVCSSRAFVIFSNPAQAQVALQAWRNVHVGWIQSWVLTLFWRSVFFFFVLVYSSPVALASSANSVASSSMWGSVENLLSWSPWLQGLLTAYLPTLILLIVNSSLNPFIRLLVWLERPLSQTSRLRSILVRQSVYTVLGTVILPSLALSTLDAFLIQSQTEGVTLRELFQNIFLPGSGAFFVNYLVQSIFVSLVSDATQLFDRLIRWWALLKSASAKEVREAVGPLEWSTVGNYANLINIFTLVMVYSLFVPVIAPMGLAYVAIKHYIDKYQLMTGVVAPQAVKLHCPRTTKRLSQLIFGAVIFAQFAWTVFLSAKVYTALMVFAILTLSGTSIFVLWWSMVSHPKDVAQQLESVPLLDIRSKNQQVKGRGYNTAGDQDEEGDEEGAALGNTHLVAEEYKHPTLWHEGGGGEVGE